MGLGLLGWPSGPETGWTGPSVRWLYKFLSCHNRHSKKTVMRCYSPSTAHLSCWRIHRNICFSLKSGFYLVWLMRAALALVLSGPGSPGSGVMVDAGESKRRPRFHLPAVTVELQVLQGWAFFRWQVQTGWGGLLLGLACTSCLAFGCSLRFSTSSASLTFRTSGRGDHLTSLPRSPTRALEGVRSILGEMELCVWTLLTWSTAYGLSWSSLEFLSALVLSAACFWAGLGGGLYASSLRLWLMAEAQQMMKTMTMRREVTTMMMSRFSCRKSTTLDRT